MLGLHDCSPIDCQGDGVTRTTEAPRRAAAAAASTPAWPPPTTTTSAVVSLAVFVARFALFPAAASVAARLTVATATDVRDVVGE